MRLALTENQRNLQQQVRSFLAEKCTPETVRAVAENRNQRRGLLWEEFGERGWLSLALPARFGGLDGDFVDLCVLLEEAGRALFPGPVLSSAVLGALTVLTFGSENQKERYLPGVGQGRSVLTVALNESWAGAGRSANATLASQTKTGFTLRGEKLFSPCADVADYILVSAALDWAPGNFGYFIVPSTASGLSVRPMDGLAPEFDCRVSLSDVRIPGDSMLGGVEDRDAVTDLILKRGAVALCALMLGSAQRILEMTVEHAKTRIQFGRPIGSFQAVQHHCANMAIDVDTMRYLTYASAGALGRDTSSDRMVALAKAWCSAAADRVSSLAHQVHAGVGFLEGHSLHLHTRRLKIWSMAYGTPTDHISVLADMLVAPDLA